MLLSFMPDNWQELAVASGALRGLRKDKSPENVLRTLLIHLGCGHSLRETVARARLAHLADLSDVALLKRLRKSKTWLQVLCQALFKEHGMAKGIEPHQPMRAFDATVVKETGPTGSQWRLHYSVTLPSMACDYFKLTGTTGQGTGESFKQFTIADGDYILADRGYASYSGLAYVAAHGGLVTLRVNTGTLSFITPAGESFDLLSAVESLQDTGAVGVWKVAVHPKDPLAGRICALRKTPEAIRDAHERIRRTAARKQQTPLEDTYRFACYVIVFTTFPASDFSATQVLQWYRLRWQIERVFKRFKSLTQLGHIPKHHSESIKAWIYGKLLVALLTENIVRHARTFSPWGYDMASQHLA